MKPAGPRPRYRCDQRGCAPGRCDSVDGSLLRAAQPKRMMRQPKRWIGPGAFTEGMRQ